MKQHPIYTKYLIGEDGSVWSTIRNKYLKPTTNEDGYVRYCLSKDDKSYNCYAQRLVMQTYEPIENDYLYDAHHQNHIRNDNRLENLKWELKGEHTSEHNKSREISNETRRKMSDAKKGKVSHRKGAVLSADTKRKVSEAMKGNTNSKGNTNNKGRKWWNNGTTNTMSKEWPGEGWVRGRM